MLGRGTQIFFSRIPGVVKVRITAPEEQCIRNLSEEQGCSPKEAEKILRHICSEREGFYKSFFHRELASPMLYDLIINTQFLDADASVKLIETATELKKNYNCSLDDLILEQDIAEKLLYTENIPIEEFRVTAEDGVVTLSGAIFGDKSAEECKKLVMGITGVKKVNTEHLIPNALSSHYRM